MSAIKFTTWTELYQRMLDDMSNDTWRNLQSYQVAGTIITYRHFDGFKKMLDYVERKAATEVPQVRRTSLGTRRRWG